MKKYLFIIFTLVVCIESTVQAQYILRPPTVRFSRPSQRGNIVYVANSIINTGALAQTTEIPPAGTGKNNSFTGNHIDVDAIVFPTNNSSTAESQSYATVLLFYLQDFIGRAGVGGTATSRNDTSWITAAANTVKFKLPGAASLYGCYCFGN